MPAQRIASLFGRIIVAPVTVLLSCLASLGAAAQQDATVDFVRDIRPILESRCVECHGPTKQKGRLRLDRRSELFKGDDPSAWNVVPRDPDNSELFFRISLPADDLDVMPAEGAPLTPTQVDLFRRWIAEGAIWPEGADIASVDPKKDRIVIPALTDDQRAAESNAIGRLEERGALVSRVAADTQALYVNFSLLGAAVTDEDLRQLDGLQPSLAWLNLGRTSVTSKGVEMLRHFPQLRRVHLQGSMVDDDALRAIVDLEHLSYLNLFATAVTDDGLQYLASMKQLRRVYLWGTQVTSEGVNVLRKALPDAQIDRGDYAIAAAVEPAPTLPPDATCCEKALFADTVCEHPCCVEAAAKGDVCMKCNPSGIIRGKSN